MFKKFNLKNFNKYFKEGNILKKRLLITVVILALAAFGLGMGTYAYFTSSASSKGNVFSTGKFEIGIPNEGENTGVISVSNWQPGDLTEKTITVINKGTLPARYRVTASKESGDDVLYNALDVVVQVGTANAKPSMKLSQLANIVLNENFAPSETGEEIKFTITLPSTVNNELEEKTASVKFTFDATQENNTDWTGVGPEI